MVLLGDEAQVEARFVPFRDGANLCRKIGARFALNVPQARKSYWTHPEVLLGDKAQVEARLSPLGDSANIDTG
jgi:hypothetical protein